MDYLGKQETARENSAGIGRLEGSIGDINQIQIKALGKYLSRWHTHDSHAIEDVCQDALLIYWDVHKKYDKLSDNHPAIFAGMTRIAYFQSLKKKSRQNKIIEKFKTSLLNREIPMGKDVHAPE